MSRIIYNHPIITEVTIATSFAKRFGELTVEQARELNEAARWYCGHEVTSETSEERPEL